MKLQAFLVIVCAAFTFGQGPVPDWPKWEIPSIKGGCDGGDSCCSPTNPCSENEGDCDRDADCQGTLLCGQNNCPDTASFDTTDDCCQTDTNTTTTTTTPTTTTTTTTTTTGGCDGGDSCCSATNPCSENE